MRERFRVDARTSANESAAAQNRANAAFVRNTNSSDTAPPTMDTNWDALDTEAHSHGADTVLAAVATCAGRRLRGAGTDVYLCVFVCVCAYVWCGDVSSSPFGLMQAEAEAAVFKTNSGDAARYCYLSPCRFDLSYFFYISGFATERCKKVYVNPQK